jgi:uncharacterized protein (DUF1684 family)
MGRKKRPPSTVIRISTHVLSHIKQRRHGKECLDETLRRIFGLPMRSGIEQKLATFYVIENSGQPLAFTDEAKARGIAIERAVKKELTWNKTERVIKVQETK